MNEWKELRQLMLDRAVKFDEGVDSKGNLYHWLVDCREVMLNPRGSHLISKLMYDKFKTFKSKNVGGLITAGIPLVSFIVHLGYLDKNPISGFFIRKEPKKWGLKKIIEGDFKPGQSVVIVDDIVNVGWTIFKAIKAIEGNGCKVEGVLTIVNFGKEGLRKLKEMNYKVEYLFEVEDFYIRNKGKEEKIEEPKVLWSLGNINKWKMSVPRSSPLFYKNSILFGVNERKFLSVNSETGKENWSLRLDINNPKGILSSPAIYGNKIFFGAYDGYLYCVNADNGNVVWKTRTGEWIGSSPCIHDGKVFVGIEYGTRGGSLCAYSVYNGKLLWNLRTRHYIHSSPTVDEKRNIVIIGCNDGYVYAADCKIGKLLWKYNIGKETKGGFVVDDDTGFVYFGSFDGNMYCFDIENGNMLWKRRVGKSVFTTPEIVNENLIFSSVSGRIFSLNKKNASINWYYDTEKQIYSTATTLNNKIYCGSDEGYLYVIDITSGELIKKYHVGKEILTKPLINNDDVYIGCKGCFICIHL